MDGIANVHEEIVARIRFGEDRIAERTGGEAALLCTFDDGYNSLIVCIRVARPSYATFAEPFAKG